METFHILLPMPCAVSLGVINGFCWLGRECEVTESVSQYYQGNGADIMVKRILTQSAIFCPALTEKLCVSVCVCVSSDSERPLCVCVCGHASTLSAVLALKKPDSDDSFAKITAAFLYESE